MVSLNYSVKLFRLVTDRLLELENEAMVKIVIIQHKWEYSIVRISYNSLDVYVVTMCSDESRFKTI